MQSVKEFAEKNAVPIFWGLVVACVLLVLMYLKQVKEGMGAGGMQAFDQVQLGTGGHEGYAARKLALEGLNGNGDVNNRYYAGNKYGPEDKHNYGDLVYGLDSNTTIKGALAAENSAELRKQLGCKGSYQGVGHQFLDKANSGNGWVARSEGMTVDDKLAGLL